MEALSAFKAQPMSHESFQGSGIHPLVQCALLGVPPDMLDVATAPSPPTGLATVRSASLPHGSPPPAFTAAPQSAVAGNHADAIQELHARAMADLTPEGVNRLGAHAHLHAGAVGGCPFGSLPASSCP